MSKGAQKCSSTAYIQKENRVRMGAETKPSAYTEYSGFKHRVPWYTTAQQNLLCLPAGVASFVRDIFREKEIERGVEDERIG